MILIALVILLVVLAIFPTIRCALLHPLLMAWNSGRDGGLEALRPRRRQRRRRGKPLPPVPLAVRLNAQHFLFQEISKGMVIPNLQGPSLGGLVVVVDLLGLIR